MVEVLSDLAYIYYSYFEDYIITGNSEITVEFIILPDFFEVNRETQYDELQQFVMYVFTDLNPQIKDLVSMNVHF